MFKGLSSALKSASFWSCQCTNCHSTFFPDSFKTTNSTNSTDIFQSNIGILCVTAMWNDGAKKGNSHNHADSVFYVLFADNQGVIQQFWNQLLCVCLLAL